LSRGRSAEVVKGGDAPSPQASVPLDNRPGGSASVFLWGLGRRNWLPVTVPQKNFGFSLTARSPRLIHFFFQAP